MWAREVGLALSLGATLLSFVYPVLLKLGIVSVCMWRGECFSFAASC